MAKRKEADRAVHISDLVMDRNGHARWAVMATFIDVDGAEPRCIEYRVRVVPRMERKIDSVGVGHQLIGLLERQAAGERSDVYLAAELSAPAEGIPRYVFEKASQSRMLEKARAKARRRPESVSSQVREVLERQSKPRRGRPPARSLGEKLRILSDIEEAYATGRALQDVADAHFMSRSAVRDVLAWGRSNDSGVQFFTGTTPGRRGGQLTPEARALLKRGVE